MGNDPLIRLTPSAERRIRRYRCGWGWRSGLPVLVSRTHGDGFRFGIPGSDTGPTIGFVSRGVRLAVPMEDADHFRASVLSANPDVLFGGPVWWLENPNDLGRSGCSDPLGGACDPDRFRRMHPELYGLRGWFDRLAGHGVVADDRHQLVARTSAYLRWGDGRAAIVLSARPAVVAAYCDEMDAAILLRFPGWVATEQRLAEGDRLVTANLHARADDGRVAPDLTPGPSYHGRYTNVRPLVADFLAVDPSGVEARRREISAAEYRRCGELGEVALRSGQGVRDGRPLTAAVPPPT